MLLDRINPCYESHLCDEYVWDAFRCCFPSNRLILERKPYERQMLTLKTSSWMIARAPAIGVFPMRCTHTSNSGWSHSITVPVEKSRKIRGDVSNEQNINVMRPFSRTCEMVSQPDPVESIYATWFGPKNARQESGKPFGERLTCRPRRGAEATKKTLWRRAQSRRSSEMDS